jgi:Tfp pilus assembly protein PilX
MNVWSRKKRISGKEHGIKIKKFSNESGSLLLEILFAFLLLSFVVISSGGLLAKTAQMSADNKGRLLALEAAQSALETIKDTSLTSIANINTAALIPANLNQGTMTIQANPTIGATTQIATITVTVSWRGSLNRTQQLQISTMKSRF